MSASDHLSKPLFHGSQHAFRKGDIVSPQGHAISAHATDDPIYAEGIGGRYVFEVTPLNPHDVQETSDDWEVEEGTRTFSSPSGFKVIRQHK